MIKRPCRVLGLAVQGASSVAVAGVGTVTESAQCVVHFLQRWWGLVLLPLRIGGPTNGLCSLVELSQPETSSIVWRQSSTRHCNHLCLVGRPGLVVSVVAVRPVVVLVHPVSHGVVLVVLNVSCVVSLAPFADALFGYRALCRLLCWTWL